MAKVGERITGTVIIEYVTMCYNYYGTRIVRFFGKMHLKRYVFLLAEFC
ncbi:MAG: hypothetical protein IJN54_15825 [Lachnospiraceae bacterium]|nr:hypothetical protein [Lachnospiraceae bacterium]